MKPHLTMLVIATAACGSAPPRPTPSAPPVPTVVAQADPSRATVRCDRPSTGESTLAVRLDKQLDPDLTLPWVVKVAGSICEITAEGVAEFAVPAGANGELTRIEFWGPPSDRDDINADRLGPPSRCWPLCAPTWARFEAGQRVEFQSTPRDRALQGTYVNLAFVQPPIDDPAHAVCLPPGQDTCPTGYGRVYHQRNVQDAACGAAVGCYLQPVISVDRRALGANDANPWFIYPSGLAPFNVRYETYGIAARPGRHYELSTTAADPFTIREVTPRPGN